MGRKHGKLRQPWATARSADPKPLARSEELVVEELEGEVLIYDLARDRAHCLGVPAAKVWRACDGKTPVRALQAALDLDADTVDRALDQLAASDLLDVGPALGTGTTRRELGVRVVKVGAAATAVPLIWSIAGPIPEAAATPTITFCAQGSTTQGCGSNCSALHCCCCCQGTFPGGRNKNCYPATLCPSVSPGAHCSNTAPCP